jgi:hypothetical protein
MGFIFILLPVLATFPYREPPNKFNVVHDKRKYNKFDTSRQFKIQMKLKLRHHIVAARSSHRVQEAIDEVVSLPATLL